MRDSFILPGGDPMAIGAVLNGSNPQVGIRKWLNDQGYNNNDIGYSNGYVTLQGRNFIQATPQAQDDLANGFYKDSTYASPTALQAALGAYQNTYGSPKVDTSSNTGRASAIGNLLNNQYSSVTSQPFQFKQQQAPFSYDPNSDQAYQAALRSAQQNIQQSQGNTLANLLAHGQGNSSYAATVAQQIANKEMSNVSNNILPQLIQQAYQRWQDQNNNDYRNQMANYGVLQDQFRNQSALANVLNEMNQQDIQNSRQSKLDNLNAALEVGNALGRVLQPKEDWSNLYNQTEAPLNLQGQQFQNTLQQQQLANEWQVADKTGVITPVLAQAYGIPEGTPTLQAKQIAAEIAARNASLGIEGMNANTSAARLAWEMNPNNPDNLYKQAEIKWRESQVNKNDNSKSPTSYKTDPNFAQDMQYVLSNPSDAANLLNSNAQAFISEYGTDGYAALRKAAGLD
jgi:hypothetical protein